MNKILSDYAGKNLKSLGINNRVRVFKKVLRAPLKIQLSLPCCVAIKKYSLDIAHMRVAFFCLRLGWSRHLNF